MEKKLRTFENKAWQKIYVTLFDVDMESWRKRYNGELQKIAGMGPITSFIKGQRI